MEISESEFKRGMFITILGNPNGSSSFVMDCGFGSEIFDCPEYNEVAWLFN